MKRLFTLAIIAMIAMLTFAQAPVQKKAKATDRKIERVASKAEMRKALEAKATFDAKAKVAEETSGSVLRHAAKRPTAATKQMVGQKVIPNAKVSNRQVAPRKQFKERNSAASHLKSATKAKAAAKLGAAKAEGEDVLELTATDYSAEYYAEDGDWFCVLTASGIPFRFDIVTNDPTPLNGTYTFDQMDPDYSWAGTQSKGWDYEDATFTVNADGTEAEAYVTLSSGEKVHVSYTKPEDPEITAYQTYEFSIDETTLTDATSTQGIFQIVGDNGEQYASVAFYSDQLAGTYTLDDAYKTYCALYLTADDYTGVKPFALNATVTEEGATVIYDAYNGTEYTLIFHFTEGGDDPQPSDVTVTKDENGIITSVEGGVEKTYIRANTGTAYFLNSNSQMSFATQSGVVTVIEDGDKVYIKDPITHYTRNSWVEGTKTNNMVVIPAGQPLVYAAQYDATVSLRYGVITSEGAIQPADDYAENFVFSVDGDTWTLENTTGYGNATGDAYFMGAFWDDDNSSTGYGDAETVLNYDSEYEAPETILVELPQGVQTETWTMNANSYKASTQTSTPIDEREVLVGIDGNDIYVKGISEYLDAWVKGTISGSTVTFKKMQFLGVDEGDNCWFIGYKDETMVDATAAYDATNKTVKFNEDVIINCAEDRIYYWEWYKNTILNAASTTPEDPVITDLTAELPYFNGFDSAAEKAEAAIYDANNDKKTWTLTSDSKTGSGTVRYQYNSAKDADDYVVFPGLTLEAGKTYDVSVDARDNGYPEILEVVVGTVAKADDLSTIVIPAKELNGKEYQTLTASFSPEADGVYYFALHAVSEKDNFYLYADNFSVKEQDEDAPNPASNIVITPDPTGALIANVKFTVPTTTIGGTALDEVKVKVSRDGTELVNAVLPAGSEWAFVDSDIPAPGFYTWTIGVATVDGQHVGDNVSAKAYIGEDIPVDVENLKAEGKNDKVALSWDPVTEGQNDGIIVPENVTYNAYPVVMEEFFGMQFPAIDYDNPYATGITETKVDIDFDTNSGEQGYTYFGVTAANGSGESLGSMTALLTGAAYEIPFHEGLTGQQLHYWWGTESDDDNYMADGGLYFSTEESSDGDNVSFLFDAEKAGWIDMLSGKIALNGAESPALSFDYKSDAPAKIEVVITTPEGEEVAETINVAVANGYETASISLKDYADQPWVRFTLHAVFNEPTMLYVDNVNVMDVISDNLSITVSAPSSVVAGKTATVKATVKNEGENVAEGYEVKFYINGQEAAAPLFEAPALAFLETAEFNFDLETSVFDEAGDVTVKAEVVYAADLKDADNADEVVIEVKASTATPVAEVTAEQNEEGAIVVNWTVTEDAAKEVTEDFESVQAPAAGLTFKDGETYGDWKAVDESQSFPYAWNSSYVLWDQEESFGFGIINFAASGLGTITPPSGEQAAVFISEYDESGYGTPSSKYMISPELPGIAQTISFMAKTTNSAEYGDEVVEIMASSTDSNVESFTKVTTFNINSDEGFSEFTADLPEGTKYFALHYVSNDVFALFIDDLTYTVGGGAAAGFNVYVDGNLVGTADADADSYTYSDELSEGEHEVSVTAVYGDNESAPVSTTVSVATAIKNINLDSAAEVFTVDGIRLNNVKNLKSGVYVVNGKKVVIK